jgi:gliding motility-associated-like protein
MDLPRLSNPLRRVAVAAILMAVAWLLPSYCKAGHIAGVDITYECMNGCTIRVYFKAYRDCSSNITNISPIGTLFMSADSGCTMPTQITPWINASNIEVTPVCPGTPTGCNTPGAAINGIMEHYWYADFDFCQANCPDYTISWQTCCRSANISTIFIPNSVGTYISATIHPLLVPCNSAPLFNNPPVPLICQGQSYVFSQGATDLDGDSLSYSLGPCMRGPGNPVPYLAFTSPTLPLGPNWTVNLNANTGDLTIAPDPNGPSPGLAEIGVICIYVNEWRNGQLINTIVRDLQLTVVPCAPNDPPTTLGITNLQGGIEVNHFALTTCVGANLCFDIRVQDSDLGQQQTVTWNQSLASQGATFALASNPAIQNTIVGQQPVIRFCWAPSAPGSYNFSVVMHDDACPIYGISQYNFQIEVGQIALTATDSVIGCKVVGMCALPLDAHYPLHYNWMGAGGLSNNLNHLDSCLNHSYPASGSYPYTLSVTDAIGCTALWQDTIVIPNNVLADAGPDMSTCSNQPLVIGNPPQVSQLLTYLWSPLTGLTNPTSAQPTVTLSNNTLTPQYAQYVLTITDTVTYCLDQDTMTLTVYPIPESPFFLQDSACQNQVVGMIYLGQNGPGTNYTWTFAGGSPPILYGQGPHQVTWATPGPHEVTLTLDQNGCTSPTERDTIFIRTNPVAQILPVADQCLVGNSFNFANFGNFTPLATHAWTFWPNAVPSGSTLQNPTGITFGTAGPKWVTVTTVDRGCQSATESLLIMVRPDPDALWGALGGVQCFDGNSYHFVAQAGNGPTATYHWTFQDGLPNASTDTLPIVSFSSPGPKVVTLTVTAFGCTSIHTDTIMVFPEPLVAVGADTSFCEGEGGVELLAIATAGTAPYYYTWTCPGLCGIDSIHDNDPNVNPSQSTTYYVQVTDANGCTSPWDSVDVTIHPKPSVHAGPDLRLCGLNAPCQILTPSVSGVGPFSFAWIPSIGLNDASLFNPCARPDTTTIYVLVATELSTGCSSAYNTLDTASSVTVHVNPVPLADAGPDRHICHADTTQLQGIGSGAGPAYQYQWTPSTGLSSPTVASPIAAPTHTTDYTLVVYSNGCPSVADTVRIDVHTMPTVDAGWDREICLGESTLLDATASGDSTTQYSFAWSTAMGLDDPFIEDPVATPPRSITYFVIATTTWGCSSAMDSVTVSLRPTPIADAGRDTTICYGEPAFLQGSYYYGPTDTVTNSSQIYYAWTPHAPGMSDSTLAAPIIYPTASGMYHLQVRYNICQTYDSVLVIVVPDLRAGVAADTATICAGDSLRLQALGGFGNASYVWAPPTGLSDPFSPHPTAFPSDTTHYTLIVSESGCQDTIGYELAVIPSPEVEFLHSPPHGCAPLTLSCLQNTSTALAYIWNFGDGSPVSNADAPVHTYAQPGIYALQFVAVHTGGCLAEAAPLEVVVSAAAAPHIVAEPSAPAIFYLPNATLLLQDIGTASSAWNWDFGDGQQAQGAVVGHTFSQPGIYFVTLRSHNAEGCLTTAEIGPFEVRVQDLFIPNVFSPNSDGIQDDYLINYTGDQPFYLQIRDRWGAQVYESRNKTQGWDGMIAGQPAADGTYYYHVRIGEKDYVGEMSLFR